MGVVTRLDDMGKPAWIGLLIVSFYFFPPLTLALLVFLFWSSRFGCGGSARWSEQRESWSEQRARWSEHWNERMGGCGGGGGGGGGSWGRGRPSGNNAFDEYRQQTLRRLEDEQREFKDYLERLRRAKDKAEFDQFMAERGRRGDTPDREAQPQS